MRTIFFWLERSREAIDRYTGLLHEQDRIEGVMNSRDKERYMTLETKKAKELAEAMKCLDTALADMGFRRMKKAGLPEWIEAYNTAVAMASAMNDAALALYARQTGVLRQTRWYTKQEPLRPIQWED